MDRTFLQTLSQICKKNPIFSLFTGLFLYVILSTVLLQLLFSIVSSVYGIPYDSLLEIVNGSITQPSEKRILRLLQAISQLLTWGLASILMGILLGNVKDELLLHRNINIVFYALTVPIIVCSLPIVQLTTFDSTSFSLPHFLADWEEWIHSSEIKQQKILIGLLYDNNPYTFLTNLLVFALIPAITEELFFRGFIQNTLSKYGIHLGIWTAALIFSAVHFQFYGFFSRLLLGAMLGYIAYGAGSIFPAILGHFLFNTISISSLYQAARNDLDPESIIESNPQDISWYWMIGAFVGVIGLFILYFQQARNQRNRNKFINS